MRLINLIKYIWNFKLIRILIKIVVTLIILFNILGISLTYFYYYKDPLVNWSYKYLFNSVLGMPYYEEPEYRNTAEDIVKFSKEEWMNFKCKPVEWDYNSRTGYFKGAYDNFPSHLSQEERLQLNCIGMDAVKPYADKSTKTPQGELCNNVFNCQIVNLAVKDYVLTRPEILWNILRIAETPCKYIKQPEEGKDNREKDFITRARSGIGCNSNYTPWYMKTWYKKEKIFIIISIWNSKNEQVARFIVRRKDKS